METPQDLIKPVAPSPSGKTSSRGPIDAGRNGESGAEFAEAMRSARESARADVRETQAPDRQPRRAPDEASEEPIVASKDKDLPAEAPGAPAARSGAEDGAQPVSGFQTQPAATDGTQQAPQIAAAPVQVPVTPVNVQVTAAEVSTTADSAIQAIAQAAAAAAPVVPGSSDNKGLAQTQALLPAPATPAATDLTAVAPLRAEAPASVTAALPAVNENATAPVQAPAASDSDFAIPTNGLPNVAPAIEASTTEQLPASAQVALAPAPVALAVDRAIGNAIVNLPATGVFKAADLAAQPPVDPARIASAGFVAVALQPQTAQDAATALSPLGEPLTTTETPEMSVWLNVRPDSLATALADRALVQDATTQLTAKLDQALQSLDAKLAGMSGSANLGIVGGEANAEEPLGAIAALADAPNNQAVQVQPAGMPTDTPEPVSLSLNAPMQQASRWAAEFGDRLAWVANNRFTAATLQINPPQLGPIEVRILMSGDQAAVSFAAVQPQTREAIQQALPVLASSFASQGLSLGQTSVGREHLPQQGGQGGSGGNGSGQPGLMAASISNAGGLAADTTTRGGNGLVDTFV